ncbi:hypothetical protein [Antarctobacter sp.]|uniref:hypothetical protein n=1 Tax=Antarctobacter sp. TaxID=1872577 RepID=UPI003A954DD7
MSYLEPIPTENQTPKDAPAADFNCGWSFMSYLVRMSAQADLREQADTAHRPDCVASV